MSGEINEAEVARIAKALSPLQRDALKPNSRPDRKGLVKLGLMHWKQRPGQRVMSLMPTPLGYAVRAYLERRP